MHSQDTNEHPPSALVHCMFCPNGSEFCLPLDGFWLFSRASKPAQNIPLHVPSLPIHCGVFLHFHKSALLAQNRKPTGILSTGACFSPENELDQRASEHLLTFCCSHVQVTQAYAGYPAAVYQLALAN